MWFIFPQLRSLDLSEMAHRYGIRSFDEAPAYLADAVLGPRLVRFAEAVLSVRGKTARRAAS